MTLLATQDANGNQITTIDGSTWDPWAHRLLFTTENTAAPTYAATPGFPSTVADVSGALGRGGYEGIQNDDRGNLWIVEDIGGSNKPPAGSDTAAIGHPDRRVHDGERPNSFLFRYVPAHKGDLANGKLQVLQVLNAAHQPITFESQAALNNPDQVALHTYGNAFQTRWVTIHDTAVDGTTPFNANTLAKTPLPTHNGNVGTPFKRPENGVFRPGSDFKQFFFDETGDTNANSPENDTAGGWGSIMKLSQSGPGADTGTLSRFYKPAGAHSSLDNVTFLSKNIVTFGQDMGDGLHTPAQRAGLGVHVGRHARLGSGQSPGGRWRGRAHRELQRNAGPGGDQELVAALAGLYSYVYAVPQDEVRVAAEQRARAMIHSDRWVDEGCDPASALIAEERAALVRSYEALREAVSR